MAAALLGYVVGLPAIAAFYVVTRIYYALQDMATPVRIGGVIVALNAVLAYLLMRPWGVAGIALAASIVSVTNVGWLLWRLRTQLGHIDGRRITSTVLRCGTAALAAGGVAAVLIPAVRSAGLVGQTLQVGAVAVVGVLVYLAACSLLQVEEMRAAWRLLRGDAR